MNHYLIEQFHISPDFKQGTYRVGFAFGENSADAINNYLLSEHPDDEQKRHFVRGYLTATECSEEVNNEFNKSMIAMGRKTIGIWL